MSISLFRSFCFASRYFGRASKRQSINENLSSAEYIGENGLYIPIGPHLTLSKQKYVAKQIINYIDKSIVGKE